jgi:hypothetical protein
MKRKKAAVAAVVNNAPVEGVIDLDSEVVPHGAGAGAPNGDGGVSATTEFHVQEHVGETVVLQPGQKAKRKYTKRAKKTDAVVTPTFVDLSAIRTARIQTFIDYVDHKITFEQAGVKDDRLRGLYDLGKEVAAEIKA